jgi:hypothetical protein
LSSPRIFSGISRTFLIVIAGSAAALAAAVPGPTAAARVPLAGRPASAADAAAAAGAGRPAAAASRPLRASLAISVIPAGPRPARYTLTAYHASPGYRAGRRAPAAAGYRASAGHRARARAGARARTGYQAPRLIAWQLLPRFHWAGWEFRYLDRLWEAESGWNSQALNPYSGAYGIPQAVPGSKMAMAGPDWRWDPRTQIRWGMSYIAGRYGSPFAAWQHECWFGWY